MHISNSHIWVRRMDLIADEKKINAFETKCYRRILRIPWIAKRKKKTQKS